MAVFLSCCVMPEQAPKASSATMAAVPHARRRVFFISLLLYEKLLWPHADD